MKQYVGRPDENQALYLKQQVSQALHRWDNSDFRVDLNWTDFEYGVLRSKIKFQKEHTRLLEFSNSGALPIQILRIQVDGRNTKRCSDFWEYLKVNNCKDLIGTIIYPQDTITLELSYYETF